MKLPLAPSDRMSASLEMIERHGLEGEDTLVVGLTFRCNSRCRFCIIETEIQNELPDADERVLEAVFAYNAENRRFRRLTLTGAEVTLLPDLDALGRAATTRGKFEVVRIQTNGRALQDRADAQRLIQSGIREYFVSIHAHTADLDASITRAPASFEQMKRGIGNLLELGAHVMSNTVVCASNVAHLPEIAGFILELGIRDISFWSFIELGRAGQHEELVSLERALPSLLESLAIAEAAGAKIELKWFPRCLLGRFADRLDNHQPQLLIRDEFQMRMGQRFGFACPHAARCQAFGHGCDGLHDRYIETFGDEAARLQPISPPESRGDTLG